MESSLFTADSIIIFLVRFWCYAVHPHQFILSRLRADQWLDPVVPVTAEEKFFWRKIFDHNPLFIVASDKLASKDYALTQVPNLRVAAVLWSGKDPALIPDNALSGSVMVKSTQGSGPIWYQPIIKGDVDLPLLHRKARRWLRRGYGWVKGEWAYGAVERRLFVEEMIMDNGDPVRHEYKFHVCGGCTVYVVVKCSGRNNSDLRYILDRDGLLQEILGEAGSDNYNMPSNFEEMRDIAERLGADFDYIRCDLSSADGAVFFSELTVYPSSGFGRLHNKRLRKMRNAKWDLQRSWFLSSRQRGWRKLYAQALSRRLQKEKGEKIETTI